MKPVETSVLLLMCLDVLATAAEPGYVSFKFDVDEVAQLYGTNAAAVQRAISVRMATNLASQFSYWDFQADLATNYPRLEVWLERNTSWTINMKLVPGLGVSSVPKDDSWSTDLFAPGQLTGEGFPSKKDLPDKIVERFGSVLLAKKESLIRGDLQTYVPLVHSVHPPEAVPVPTNQMTNAVLPLEWSRYQTLCISLFRIECRKKLAGPVVNIYSQGQGQCSAYPLNSSLRGLTVEHQRWGSDEFRLHLNEVTQLNPLRIYLEKYEFVGEMSCEDSLPQTLPRTPP
jgi:predicted membrane protein